MDNNMNPLLLLTDHTWQTFYGSIVLSEARKLLPGSKVPYGAAMASPQKEPKDRWRRQGERHAASATRAITAEPDPVVEALLAIYYELRHAADREAQAPPSDPALGNAIKGLAQQLADWPR